MQEFDQMWEQTAIAAAPLAADIARHEDTQEYQLKQGLANTAMLVDFLGAYYFARHGQIQDPLFAPECDDIEFILTPTPTPNPRNLK